MNKANEKAKTRNSNSKKPLLNVEKLNMSFKIRGLYFNALKNISFSVNQGDFFGIIGESGSGKSTTGKCIIKLYQPTGGKIEIDNHLISNKRLSYKTNKWLRKNVQMIFQDPMASLNPTKNVLQLISEPLVINKTIYKNAVSHWKKLNNVAKYFLIEYIQSNDRLVYDYQFQYLSTIKNILVNSLKNYNDDFLDTDSYKKTREKLIFKLDTLVENYQNTSSQISEFINNSQKLTNDLIEKYNNEDFNDVFKKYENTLKELKKWEGIYKYSAEGVNYLEEIKKTKAKLKEVKNDFDETYIKQSYGYIKSFEITTKGYIKSIKQNMEYSKDDIDYTVNFINLTIQKFLLLFVKHLKKYKFLESDTINESIKKITNIIETLFKPINEKIMKLSVLFENTTIQNKNVIIQNLQALRMFGEMLYISFKDNSWNNQTMIEKKYNEIYEICPKFNDLDRIIDCSIYKRDEFHETIEKNASLYREIETIFNSLIEQSIKRKNEHVQEYESLRNNLESFKLDFKITNEFYKNENNEKRKNEKIFNSILSDFSYAKNEREKYLEEVVFVPLHSEERIERLHEEAKNISELKKEIKLLSKEFKNKNKKIVESIKLKMKNEKSNTNSIANFFSNLSFIKYLKKEIALRYKSVDALKFEYKNSLKESKLNAFIFEKSRFINWMLIPLLTNLIKKDLVYKALDSVGLKREHAYRYPHEFSGGQRQRIVIARALINNPKIIIADEPISALDVSIQAQIINILQDLCKKQNMTILFIAHDLSMVNYACNNVIIMHRGRILEKGNVNKIFENPVHPYTRSLMKATPKLSRVHVDLAAFNEDFTYDKEWSAFNKPSFIKINGSDHEVYGTNKQIEAWIEQSKNENEN